jgi:predicted naringenin-chalcone synthase
VAGTLEFLRAIALVASGPTADHRAIVTDTLTSAPGRPATERAPRRPSATLRDVATATPDVSFDQSQMLELLGLESDPFATEIFARCGVRARALEISPERLRTSLQARTPVTEDQLMRLATRAVDGLAVDLDDIGVLVTASYYTLGGPTLAHRLIDHYGLRSDVDKYHLAGVGCASAVPLLRLATQALRDRAGELALVVAAESASGFLSPISPGDDKVKIIGSALFADGAAAALLELGAGSQGAGPAIVATAVHQVPGTLDHVRFAVSEADSHMYMARELPELAERCVPALVETFLEGQGLDRAAIDHWPVHPGGRGIIEGLQRGLGLSDAELSPSAAVLAEHGNVGTPSAFFVLERTLADRCPLPGDRGLAITIGPGVTVGLMLLQW